MTVKNIVLDVEKTFGDLYYIGSEEAYEYKDNRRTDTVAGYYYNLASSVQGDTVRIKVLGDRKEFKMMQKVKLIGLETRIYATTSGKYANVNFSLVAHDISNG